MTDEDWVNKAIDARHRHVRSGNDNCDKCYYNAAESGDGAGHRSNIINHFFSDEYIHSQFHKCPTENCDFGYCMLKSLITHAEIKHNGSLRQSLQNQNTGGIFYWIVPKTKEILAPVQLSSLIPIEIEFNNMKPKEIKSKGISKQWEKLTPKRNSNPRNTGTSQKQSVKSGILSNPHSSITEITSKSEGIDSLPIITNNPIKDFDSRKLSLEHANPPSSFISKPNSWSDNSTMPTAPITTTSMIQNIIAPVHLINMINSQLVIKHVETSNLAGKLESIDNNGGSQKRMRQRRLAKGNRPKAPGQRVLKNGQRHLAKATTSRELEEIKKQMKHFETLLKEFDDIKDMILENALCQESRHHQFEVSTQSTQTENEDVESIDQNAEEIVPLVPIKQYHQGLRGSMEDHDKEFTLLDHEDEENLEDYIVLTTNTGISPQRRRMRRSFFYREGSQWGF